MKYADVLLSNSCHYQHPLSLGSWIAYQSWRDVVFLHWTFPQEIVAKYIPRHKDLAVDTFDGNAWVSLVGFNVSNAHLRYLPPVPGVAAFAELNLRTYVTYKGQPGIVFMHIDTSNPIAAELLRLTGLPYQKAYLKNDRSSLNCISPDLLKKNLVDISWHTGDEAYKKTALDNWLLERYCNYQQAGSNVYCYPVCHFPWPLTTMTLLQNNISYKWNHEVHLAGKNIRLAHYSTGIDALFYRRDKIAH